MPVSQPNLTIALTENTGCSGISLADTTDDYGVGSNPAVSDVTTVTISMEYSSLETTIEYVFSLLAFGPGTITGATLSIAGDTPVDIFSSLPSDVWPFATTLPFDLTGDYGVTLPTFTDEVFTVDYTIAGSSGGDDFEYTTTAGTTVLCNSRCCLNRLWIAIDPSCDCSTEAMNEAIFGESLYNKVVWSAENNDVDGAVAALASLNRLCDSNCGGCGC